MRKSSQQSDRQKPANAWIASQTMYPADGASAASNNAAVGVALWDGCELLKSSVILGTVAASACEHRHARRAVNAALAVTNLGEFLLAATPARL
jgi:hypothetical protein